MIQKVISGGQTGADVGGLRGGRRAGVETGGWVPLGWRTDDGPAPWLADYGCEECTDAGYAEPTVRNVAEATATLIVGRFDSPGARCTINACARLHRPLFRVPWTGAGTLAQADATALAGWLRETRPTVLNVAGNRERLNPGIAAFAEELAYNAVIYERSLDVLRNNAG